MSSEYGENPSLSYNKYLKVPQLNKLQETLSNPTSHDELLFIVIHQTYELWFKQILHEIDGTIHWLGENRLFRANHAMKVVVSIEEILVNQIHILETMAPIGFLEFRDKLNPASGFQSMQFREVEFVSGAKDEKLFNFLLTINSRPKILKNVSMPPLFLKYFGTCWKGTILNARRTTNASDLSLKFFLNPKNIPRYTYYRTYL